MSVLLSPAIVERFGRGDDLLAGSNGVACQSANDLLRSFTRQSQHISTTETNGVWTLIRLTKTNKRCSSNTLPQLRQNRARTLRLQPFERDGT